MTNDTEDPLLNVPLPWAETHVLAVLLTADERNLPMNTHDIHKQLLTLTGHICSGSLINHASLSLLDNGYVLRDKIIPAGRTHPCFHYSPTQDALPQLKRTLHITVTRKHSERFRRLYWGGNRVRISRWLEQVARRLLSEEEGVL